MNAPGAYSRRVIILFAYSAGVIPHLLSFYFFYSCAGKSLLLSLFSMSALFLLF